MDMPKLKVQDLTMGLSHVVYTVVLTLKPIPSDLVLPESV